jgi:BirA family biotin operon repressor/biotin-[acetyl-CoA-carboxylase] ligase
VDGDIRGNTRRVEILALDEIDSTNAEARRRAEAGATGPLWISALRQTAGRGRRGRVWETGAGGNLAATLLLHTDKPPGQAAQISFVAALAVTDLVRDHVHSAPAEVKWPNDVLVQGRKIAGVLVESGPAPSGGQWLAVGVGVNLAEGPVVAERPATSFAAEGAAPPSPHDAVAERAHGLGQACRAHLGDQVIDGVAEGLEPDGALRLRLADGGVRRISAGDVFFGEA